jgi:hypothetical protein
LEDRNHRQKGAIEIISPPIIPFPSTQNNDEGRWISRENGGFMNAGLDYSPRLRR